MLSIEQLNNVSEIDFVYLKRGSVKMSMRPRIIDSKESYALLMHYWDKGKLELMEESKALFLNRDSRVLYIMSLSKGGICGTVMDPRLIMGMAVKVAATSLILAHNHPSGSIYPSNTDERLTNRIKEAALIMDIILADHLIVTADGYYSFRDNGLLS